MAMASCVSAAVTEAESIKAKIRLIASRPCLNPPNRRRYVPVYLPTVSVCAGVTFPDDVSLDYFSEWKSNLRHILGNPPPLHNTLIQSHEVWRTCKPPLMAVCMMNG